MEAAYIVIDLLSAHSTLLLSVIVLYFVIFKILKLFNSFAAPELTYVTSLEGASDGTVGKSVIPELVKKCPLLRETYVPPWLWGRNGHVQTAIYGILGHHTLIREADKRHYIILNDNTTVTFDVFEPAVAHARGDFTLALCPGIANSSESNYIRTCVHHAQEAGLRCSVLNHLGALKDEQLTSPRVFKYGGTEEFGVMVSKLKELYPDTKLIVVGFSMGANIITKFLGESELNSERVIIGMSVGQGYDAIKTTALVHSWEAGRRIYEVIMTENVKSLLRRHYKTVIQPYVEKGLVDETSVWSSTSFVALDEHFTRRMAGFKNLHEYYLWCSSIRVLDQIRIPMIYVNALDDPIIPPPLWEPIKKFAETRPNVLFALTQHGGHLGFLEGSSFSPLSVTWLDRLIAQVSNASIDVCSH